MLGLGRHGAAAIVLLALAVTLTGCGESETGPPSDLVPDEVALYVEITARPDAEAAAAIAELEGRLPGEETLSASLIEALDRELADEAEEGEFTYSQDIEPWLGDRVAAFASDLESAEDVTFLLETTDPEATDEAMKKLAEVNGEEISEEVYEGAKIIVGEDEEDAAAAILNGYAIVGERSSVEDVIEIAGGHQASLADSGRLGVVEELGSSEAVAFALFDFERAAAVFPFSQTFLAREDIPDTSSRGERPAAVFAAAEDDTGPAVSEFEGQDAGVVLDISSEAIRLDTSAPAPEAQLTEDSGPSPFASVPKEAFLVATAPNAGGAFSRGFMQGFGGTADPELFRAQLRAALGFDPLPALDALGDAVLFASGTRRSDLGAAAVFEITKNRRKVESAIFGAAGFILREFRGVRIGPAAMTPARSPSVPRAGYSIQSDRMPQPAHVTVQTGNALDRLIVAYGGSAFEQAIAPRVRFSSSDLYLDAQDAISPEFDLELVVAVPMLLEALDALGATRDADYREARPYLEAIDLIASGSDPLGDRLVTRFLIATTTGAG